MGEQYLIQKYGGYYRPDSAGYTDDIAQAGLFSREHAEAEAGIEEGIHAVSLESQAHVITRRLYRARQDVAELERLQALATGRARRRVVGREKLPIEDAPRDGTPVLLHVPATTVPAFWCDDLERWVTTQEYRINSIHNPEHWSRYGPAAERAAEREGNG